MMKKQSIRALLRRRDWGTAVTAAGWLRTRRDSKGGFSFLEINDGSCFANLQVVADRNLANYDSDVLNLFPGSSLQVKGELRESPGAGQDVEVLATELTVLGLSDPAAYPLQKQRVSFERLRELAHLRARTNTFGAVTRVRNALAYATHRFFQEREFYYLNAPIITASDCEGAGAMFQVTSLDLDKPPRTEAGTIDYGHDFFACRTHLTVSGQLEAEAYASALGRVYTFGPTFRAENSNTSRHLAEFWMVEPEMAFADLDDDAELAADLLRYVAASLLEQCADDLDFFQRRIEPDVRANLEQIATQPFTRISYTEAVAALRAAREPFEFEPQWGADLQAEHERFLTETHAGRALIVTDYPRAIKPFYMRVNDDERTVAAMDVLVPRIGEIIGGSQREDRCDVLQQRLRETGLDPDAYDWYLDLRRFGSAPHAGFGLGFERLVQFATGMSNIRDVIPFPRTPRNAAF